MENTPAPRKWRLNLFDIVIIVVVVAAAVLIIRFLNNSRVGVISPSVTGTTVYTIELLEVFEETANLMKPGDELVDRIEKRRMGTVETVEVVPATRIQKNELTGERIQVEIPTKYNVILTVSSEVTETDNQISTTGGFVIRVGSSISVVGPLYFAAGYILDMERGGA